MTPHPPVIRTATDTDRHAVWIMLGEEGWTDSRRDIVWPVWAALDEDTAVGMLHGRFDQHYDPAWRSAGHDGPQAWVSTIFVARAHRRRGIGHALLAEFAGQANAHGCTFLALGISRAGGPTARAEREQFFHAYGLRPMPGGEEFNVHGVALPLLPPLRGKDSGPGILDEPI